MKLFLIRHAEAEMNFPEGLGDESRCLTQESRTSIGGHFASLKEELGAIERIDASPFMRCVQTAQILAESLSFHGPLVANQFLLPDKPPTAIRTLMRRCRFDSWALVGHNPNVGSFAAQLLHSSSIGAPVAPGTVIALESEGDSLELPFRLRFVASPP